MNIKQWKRQEKKYKKKEKEKKKIQVFLPV